MAHHVCLHCGKPFVAKSRKRKYCCHQCAMVAIRTRRQRTCEQCGKIYEATGEHNTRFCSRECWRAAKVPKPHTGACAHCGKPFEYSGWYKRITCSKECAFAYLSATTSTVKPHACAVCGKTFKDGHKRKYCSRECARVARIGQRRVQPEIVPCPHCGKPFERPANRNHRVKQFCSVECRWKFKRELTPPIICKNCGKEFPVIPSKRARPYCSPACYIEYKMAHRPYRFRKANVHCYGLNWFEQRDLRRQLDGYRCQNCDAHERDLHQQLHVHHITPFREFGIERYQEANRLDNLVSLCSGCHKKLEHHPQLARLLGNISC